MKKTFAALIVAFAASSAVPAFAAEPAAAPAAAATAAPAAAADHQAAHKGHARHHKGHKKTEAAKTIAAVPFNKLPASTQAYIKAGEDMHRDMMINYTGDADFDFARAMTPHHEGAVKMAEAELKYGKNPEMRELAKNIIAAQKKEVAQMQAFVKAEEKAAAEKAKAEKKAAKEQAKAEKKAAAEKAKAEKKAAEAAKEPAKAAK